MQNGQPPREEDSKKGVGHKQDGNGRGAHSLSDGRALAIPMPFLHDQLDVDGGKGEDVDAEERGRDDEQEEEAVVALQKKEAQESEAQSWHCLNRRRLGGDIYEQDGRACGSVRNYA